MACCASHKVHENIYHPKYRQTPVRYQSALGGRRWLPCLWRGYEYWGYQMDLYRKTGAGLAIGNGWIEYDGLTTVPNETKRMVMKDMAEVVRESNRS